MGSGTGSEMLRRGVSVILGRSTALRIRKVVDLPVVEIPIPFEDMADTLIEASSYGRNIRGHWLVTTFSAVWSV